MKRLVLMAVAAVLLPALVLAQDDRHDKHRRGGHPGAHHAAVRGGVRPIARSQLLVTSRAHSAIAFPAHGPGGAAIHASVFARTNFSGNPVIRAHMSIITGASFRTQIGYFNVHENIMGHYYWHTGNGFNYCHYYDRWGYHWYGWYLGNSYFWTRWYSNNWWWYDPVYFRWCYWNNGGWWWQDPNTTTVYVYNNGSYSPANGGGNVGGNSEPGAPPQAQGSSSVFYSNDGTREVKLSGGDAFLYDISGQNSFKPLYLASNVTGVKFSNTSTGKPLQIMLTFSDGSFGLFDDQGNSLSGGNGGSTNDNQPPANGGAPPVDNGSAQPPANGGGNPPPAPGSGT